MAKKEVKIVQAKANKRIAILLICIFIILIIAYIALDIHVKKITSPACQKYGDDYMLVRSQHRVDLDTVKGTEYFCCRNASTDCYLLDEKELK